MSRAEDAKAFFLDGCNCCQAVFCAFIDKTKLEREEALRLAAGFGAGFGRMREVCGAVSGMTMALSYKFACPDPKNREKKTELYSLIRRAAEEFREINGSIVCRELLGLGGESSSPVPEKRNAAYYRKRPCAELVKTAAGIAEKYIEKSD